MTGRVLVVDDIPINQRLLAARLTAEYYEVQCASSGPEALEMIAAKHPDVVLLDVMMPGIMTSSSTTSGCFAAIISSASGPELAHWTS